MQRKDSFNYRLFFKKNVLGIVFLLIVVLLSGFLKNSILPQNAAISETIPFYDVKVSANGNFKLNLPMVESDEVVVSASDLNEEASVEIFDNNEQPHLTSLIGVDDITYQPETDMQLTKKQFKEDLTEADIESLKNIDNLKRSFYIVDKRTDITASDVDAVEFLNKDLTIDNEISGPKILIFHTHSSEGFKDSDMSKGIQEGIWGAGERLKENLESKYGIEVLHDTGRYDIVDGKSQILGAYERMEPPIRKILADNPSIQFVIDMHRDGVGDDTHLVKNINGKDTAQIMFFNGLCKLNKNGSLSDIPGLSNNYVRDNLALSFNMQVAANKMYPSFTRKVYLNAYRYSLHMLPKSMLIEVGAQTNTKEEIYNAMDLLADVLASVVLK